LNQSHTHESVFYTKSINAAFQREVDSIQAQLDQAETETSGLSKQEDEASSNLADLKRKIAALKASTHKKEDSVALQKDAYKSFEVECDQVISDKKREGARKISLAKSQLLYIEKELDHLIATHPHQNENHSKELASLKEQYENELLLARDKVAVMLERKKSAVEDASVRLSSLQRDIAELERQIDHARTQQILGESK
jgi:chromosome segregation ATPase